MNIPKRFSKRHGAARLLTATLIGLSLSVLPAAAQRPVVTAGANMDIDFNQEIAVGYSGFVGSYFLGMDLIHDPGAGPMVKLFEAPVTDTLDRILLDATLPNPQPIQEEISVLAPGPDGLVSVAVSDWHEHIMTDGFEWVLPGDDRFPALFPVGTSLITRNGEPHPWQFSPTPADHGPDALWVEFPPVQPGEILDVHKALLWVGTPGNRIWGDDVLDDGTAVDESVIRVWEYPTPEPSSGSLLALGALVLIMLRGSLVCHR